MRIRITFSDQELRTIEYAADKLNMTVPLFIRNSALQAAKQ